MDARPLLPVDRAADAFDHALAAHLPGRVVAGEETAGERWATAQTKLEAAVQPQARASKFRLESGYARVRCLLGAHLGCAAPRIDDPALGAELLRPGTLATELVGLCPLRCG